MQEKVWFRWPMLIIFTLCIAAGSWGLNSVPSLGPAIKESMNLTTIKLGALMTSFYVGTTAMAFAYSFFLTVFQ